MSDTKRDIDHFEPIVNRVSQSGLETINLEDFLPKQEILELDIKDFLFQGLLLREKEFLQQLKEFDWSKFEHKIVALFCSTDALVQQWAFMQFAKYLQHAEGVYFGTKNEVLLTLHLTQIRESDFSEYEGKRVIVKGCGKEEVSDAAYLEVSKKLLPIVQSMMYGEACSNVPIFKKRK